MIKNVLQSSEWTSASPGHINHFIQANSSEDIDFESEIKDIIEKRDSVKGGLTKPKTEDEIKTEKSINKVTKKLKSFDKGNVGDIQRFSSEQFSNVKGLASNPTQFIMGTFFKKFAKGAGVVALALLIFEAVQWIISELMKPGRWLDRRFRRDIEHEILAFRSREEKQKLNQGLSSVIVTSIGGLRGGQNQTFYTARTVASGQSLFQPNFRHPQTETIAAGLSISKEKGHRSFGGPGS